MLRSLLRRMGYVSIDYGFSCGRHWVKIDGKVIAQTSGDDFWMRDEDIRRLAIAVIEDCRWTPVEGDHRYIQAVKQRWPWHDLDELVSIKRGDAHHA